MKLNSSFLPFNFSFIDFFYFALGSSNLRCSNSGINPSAIEYSTSTQTTITDDQFNLPSDFTVDENQEKQLVTPIKQINSSASSSPPPEFACPNSFPSVTKGSLFVHQGFQESQSGEVELFWCDKKAEQLIDSDSAQGITTGSEATGEQRNYSSMDEGNCCSIWTLQEKGENKLSVNGKVEITNFNNQSAEFEQNVNYSPKAPKLIRMNSSSLSSRMKEFDRHEMMNNLDRKGSIVKPSMQQTQNSQHNSCMIENLFHTLNQLNFITLKSHFIRY